MVKSSSQKAPVIRVSTLSRKFVTILLLAFSLLEIVAVLSQCFFLQEALIYRNNGPKA
jgi:hypothetical protein